MNSNPNFIEGVFRFSLVSSILGCVLIVIGCLVLYFEFKDGGDKHEFERIIWRLCYATATSFLSLLLCALNK